jgi:hypothetical protein
VDEDIKQPVDKGVLKIAVMLRFVPLKSRGAGWKHDNVSILKCGEIYGKLTPMVRVERLQ